MRKSESPACGRLAGNGTAGAIYGLALTGLASLALVAAPTGDARAEIVPLDRISHIHDLAVDSEHPSRLYLATHDGLFLAAPDGKAERIGEIRDDLMSFAAGPGTEPKFYASGHPQGGGNLGLISSPDRGGNWQPVSAGAGGPVDFHALAVSGADPDVIYGSFQGLQVSRDGGLTWRRVGPLPDRTFDLAASARDPGTVYAAAMDGLFLSTDGGGSWRPALMQQQPATLVEVSASGRVYAFVYGVGLLARDEPGAGWAVRSSDFGDRYPIELAIDPGDPERIHIVADTGAILTSKDGGRTWGSYRGHDRETPEFVASARRTYEEYCQSCHGEKGVGERPQDMNGQDEYGFVAPPLDNSSHGWHHDDDNLAMTILNGSPRNPRMLPFKEIISEEEARNTVAYIKSLWSFRSLACQGALHMKCMH